MNLDNMISNLLMEGPWAKKLQGKPDLKTQPVTPINPSKTVSDIPYESQTQTDIDDHNTQSINLVSALINSGSSPYDHKGQLSSEHQRHMDSAATGAPGKKGEPPPPLSLDQQKTNAEADKKIFDAHKFLNGAFSSFASDHPLAGMHVPAEAAQGLSGVIHGVNLGPAQEFVAGVGTRGLQTPMPVKDPLSGKTTHTLLGVRHHVAKFMGDLQEKVLDEHMRADYNKHGFNIAPDETIDAGLARHYPHNETRQGLIEARRNALVAHAHKVYDKKMGKIKPGLVRNPEDTYTTEENTKSWKRN